MDAVAAADRAVSGGVVEELGADAFIYGTLSGIPEDELIVTCVAMGWPAEDFAANDVKADRLPVDRIVSFVGFDD